MPGHTPTVQEQNTPRQTAEQDKFSQNQRKFISTLAGETGLDVGVVAAWLAQEEPVGADGTVGRSDQNWLNVGITDSKSYGVGNDIWKDPEEAAKATAAWMSGEDSVPGYGKATPGIQNILKAADKDPLQQVRAIQLSGWASGGESSMMALYNKYKNVALGVNSPAGNAVSEAAKAAASAPLALAKSVADLASTAEKFIEALFSSATWFRVGKVLIGVFLGLFGIVILARPIMNSSPTLKKAATAAAMA